MGTRLLIGRVDLGGGDLRGVIAMNDQKVKVDRLQFGIFEVELKSGELRRSGVRVGLQRLPFKILVTLLDVKFQQVVHSIRIGEAEGD